jgi:hypothetical protein
LERREVTQLGRAASLGNIQNLKTEDWRLRRDEETLSST